MVFPYFWSNKCNKKKKKITDPLLNSCVHFIMVAPHYNWPKNIHTFIQRKGSPENENSVKMFSPSNIDHKRICVEHIHFIFIFIESTWWPGAPKMTKKHLKYLNIPLNTSPYDLCDVFYCLSVFWSHVIALYKEHMEILIIIYWKCSPLQ